MPRTNLSSQFTPEQRKAWAPKIIARNTFKYTRDGETIIRLHETDIVTQHADGSVTLNSGGWKTPTTKDRMGYGMPEGIILYQNDGQWYVAKSWKDRYEDKKAVPFFDGIRVPQCFENIKAQKKAAGAERREKELREKIRKFVKKIDGLKELPEPNQGDCWYCHMHVAEGADKGKPWGDVSHSDHILQHLREGYLHGSLILNALKWAGYREPGVIWHMANHDMKEGRKRHSCADSVKRALKRYLYRQCGLVS